MVRCPTQPGDPTAPAVASHHCPNIRGPSRSARVELLPPTAAEVPLWRDGEVHIPSDPVLSHHLSHIQMPDLVVRLLISCFVVVVCRWFR